MKFHVVKEVRVNEGKREVWYLVEITNKIINFFHSRFPFFFYSPHRTLKSATKEAEARSKGVWDKAISRSVVK